MLDFQTKDKYNVDDFRKIMELLRSPGGCPWDAEQTHESIRRNVIEEAYELAQAIDKKDRENLREELGDLLMQVIFHARIEEEAGFFDLDDVADAACKKLIFRHPHVFGDQVCENSSQVLDTWDAAKKIEKGQKTTADTMAGVAETLPALMRAEKVHKKAAAAGLESTDIHDFAEILRTESYAIEQAAGDADSLREHIGRLLYAAAATAACIGADPEAELHKQCGRAIERVRRIERGEA